MRVSEGFEYIERAVARIKDLPEADQPKERRRLERLARIEKAVDSAHRMAVEWAEGDKKAAIDWLKRNIKRDTDEYKKKRGEAEKERDKYLVDGKPGLAKLVKIPREPNSIDYCEQAIFRIQRDHAK